MNQAQKGDSEPGWNLNTPNEIGSRTLIYFDDFQANRSPDKRYRTTPLGGVYARQRRLLPRRAVCGPGGQHLGLNQNAAEKNELIEYLKSL
jgi:hypothetical protein